MKKGEKEVSDEQIQEKLNLIITNHPDKTIRLLTKLIFNLRFDLDELKIELLKILREDDGVTSHGENGECNDGEYYS